MNRQLSMSHGHSAATGTGRREPPPSPSGPSGAVAISIKGSGELRTLNSPLLDSHEISTPLVCNVGVLGLTFVRCFFTSHNSIISCHTLLQTILFWKMRPHHTHDPLESMEVLDYSEDYGMMPMREFAYYNPGDKVSCIVPCQFISLYS